MKTITLTSVAAAFLLACNLNAAIIAEDDFSAVGAELAGPPGQTGAQAMSRAVNIRSFWRQLPGIRKHDQ